MAFEITDSSAKNIYRTLYSYYNGAQLPDDSTGVFFDFANYTKDKLIYTIEFMKRQFSLGWFTQDYATRSAAIDKIARALYTAFNQTVSIAGIKKFCNWVYSFATHDTDAANYFAGNADYSYFDALFKDVSTNLGDKVTNALETVEYGVKYPSIDKITPTRGTLVKWGLLGAGAILGIKYISKKFF